MWGEPALTAAHNEPGWLPQQERSWVAAVPLRSLLPLLVMIPNAKIPKHC